MTAGGSRRWVVLAALSLAVLMVAVDATVLNLAIPEITRELDPTSTQLLWILDVYSLVLAGLLVSAGTLSDRLGRKRVLLAGCAMFQPHHLVVTRNSSRQWKLYIDAVERARRSSKFVTVRVRSG